jgi:hypothetical protein
MRTRNPGGEQIDLGVAVESFLVIPIDRLDEKIGGRRRSPSIETGD